MIKRCMIIILALLLSGCGPVARVMSINEAVNDVGYEVLKALDKKENILISPLSISSGLTLLANGTGSETQEEVLSLLGVEKLSDINNYYEHYYDIENAHSLFTLANGCFLDENATIQNHFLNNVEQFLRADVYSVNFNDETTVHLINDWVSQSTDGMVNSIVKETKTGDFAYLMNALYFESVWLNEFQGRTTRETEFFVDDSKITVDMMNTLETLQYLENDKMQLVRKPFEYGEMILILPKNDMKDLLDIEYQEIETWINQTVTTRVQLGLPKFSFSETYDLKSTLKALGIISAFDKHLSDFTPMVIAQLPIVLNKVKHSVAIEVNEVGAKAGAITSLELVYGSRLEVDEPKTMVCNKPFMFMIKDEKDVNLFHGIVYEPNEN